MRLLISALSVVFVVSFTPTSKATDIGDLNSGIVKDDAHSIKNFALEQSKTVTKQIDRGRPSRTRLGKGYMTVDQIISLVTYYKKWLEKNKKNRHVLGKISQDQHADQTDFNENPRHHQRRSAHSDHRPKTGSTPGPCHTQGLRLIRRLEYPIWARLR